jgi:hypothetical protein
MPRKVYGGRALLNLPGHHSSAAIIAEVEDTRAWGLDRDKSGEPLGSSTGYSIQPRITCKITDCDNAAHIEFDLGTDHRLENSLHKVDTMIDTLRKFRKGLVEEDKRLRQRRTKLRKGTEHGTFMD